MNRRARPAASAASSTPRTSSAGSSLARRDDRRYPKLMNVPMGKFKAGMSRYIRAANAGKEVVVTSRGKALVRLVPIVEKRAESGIEEQSDERLEELRARLKAAMPGVRVGKGRSTLGAFRPIKLKPGTKTMA